MLDHDTNRRWQRVSVSGTGSFLPNDPVPTEQIDRILGPLDDAPQAVRKFVERAAGAIIQRMGIEHRYFAIDPDTGQPTHSACSLAEEAARRALDASGHGPRDVDLLLVSTPLPDQMTPPTSAILQERLGIGDCAEMEIHSNCSGVAKCVQIAFDALRLGRYRTALVAYSQLSSVYLRRQYFNQAKVSKTQALLRYILADGSGALVLDRVDSRDGEAVPGELLGTHVESGGSTREPGMTGGAGAVDFLKYDHPGGVYEAGSHHLDQDLAMVGRIAHRELFEGVKRTVKAAGLLPEEVDWILASVPSRSLYNVGLKSFLDYFPSIPRNPVFPCSHIGYAGGAAILVQLDQLVRSGTLQRGQTVVLHSIESSKWMAGGLAIRW
jgi:3-oxoacyl-[acyl-carrier-protein] synthase-3